MPAEHRRLGLDRAAERLADLQRSFSTRHRIRLYDEVRRSSGAIGSEGICHNLVVEEIALPGQVVVGTDSHTCTAGALGCLAFGVGSTDMACAWRTGDVRLTVPETTRLELTGALRPWVSEKDLMLHVLGMDTFRDGTGIGRVLEWGGPGIASLSVDQRATLTNMAVEAGALTGIVEPDETTRRYLAETRAGAFGTPLLADPDAEYASRRVVPLDALEATVSTPGDPRNATPLSRLLDSGPIRVDIAYGGSCTGGKASDMDLDAAVLLAASRRGLRVESSVRFFIQFGSQKVRRYAEERGYDELFRSVGVELLEPSCGACIRAGPGVSERPDQVTISATNRNFPGRSGPGSVYLASPLVVAASAIFGQIVSPERILP
jgi:3-isopropylmalate/(R)-2-methylmalate dehydratase large subunit